jgi:hypothetical protein
MRSAGSGDDDEAVAKALREADDKLGTKRLLTYTCTDEAMIDYAYRTLAAVYLEELRQDAGELDYIDADNEIVSSATLTNEIGKRLWSADGTKRYGKYSAYFILFGMLKSNGASSPAFAGSITVTVGRTSEVFVVVSSVDSTMALMKAYLKELKALAEDLYKQALTSVIEELSDVTGINDMLVPDQFNKFKKAVNKVKSVLQTHGLGDIVDYISDMRDWCDWVKDLVAVETAADVYDALNTANTIYGDMKDEDFSRSDIENGRLSGAADKVKDAAEKLEGVLFDYLYNTEEGIEYQEMSFWQKTGKWIKSIFSCPVDFVVYDSAGNEIGYCLDGEVWYTEDIYIELRGDVKYLYVPEDMEVSVEFIPTDSGTMDYVVEEYDDGSAVGRLNYYDVPLAVGRGYVQSLGTEDALSDVTAFPLTGDAEALNADEYLTAENTNAHVTVSVSADEGGVDLGETVYPKGDSAELLAVPLSENYMFTGWFVGDELVETGAVYRFAAKEDVSVRASFRRRMSVDVSYRCEAGEDYSGSAWAAVYACQDGTAALGLWSMDAASATLFETVTMELYDGEGTCIASRSLSPAFERLNSGYWIYGLDLADAAVLELYDSDSVLIATLRNDWLQGTVLACEDLVHTSGSVTLTALIDNRGQTALTGALIAAVYDSRGAMLGSHVISGVEAAPTGETRQELSVSYPAQAAGEELSVKLYYVSASLVPLAEAAGASWTEG